MNWQETYERYTAALRAVPRPLALVDEEALYENAQRVLAYAGKLPVRIATKSIRCGSILRRLFSYSERFQGMLCMSAREGLYLAREGFDDLLIGYPFYQQAELSAFRSLLEAGKKAIAIVDSPAHVEALQKALEGTPIRAQVCLDVDVSSDWKVLYFGVRRSPINTPEKALELARFIQKQSHLELVGLMAYEAQIAGVGEHKMGWKGPILRFLKAQSWKEVQRRRQETIEALKAANFSLRLVNGGGTGSLRETSTDPSVTEVTAGSAFFAPALFDHYEKVQFAAAAGFSLEIVRQPARDIFTCHGGGYIASGAVGLEKLPRPWLPPSAQFLPHEGAGEIQTPVHIPDPPPFLRIGAPLYFRHAKAGELTQRFPQLHIIRGEKLVEQASTYASLPEVWV
ncbi:MAG: alanine racemase [Bacteroidia bacterium]|nr:alanine racemase [Bacteroidia bacterium]MCX7651866.1 alanine racemase [Bacteroidia bacterium]MDW8415984.1 alanine racemase [Bacteroidia bacterium]